MKKNFINKRKKNIFNLNINIVILLIFFIVFFYIYINFYKLNNISVNFIQKYSEKYNLILLNVKVTNLDYLNQREILEYFDQYRGKSIFLVPIKKIADEIGKIKWVKKLKIKSDYKNTLNITILEEIPFGIYDNNNQKILFSHNLIILDIVDNKKTYSDLITFYGENSIYNSKNLIINLDKNFQNTIDEAIFIENRRWNIKLNNLILLKLPEENIDEAINNYKKIYANFSNKDLKDIESIDLRIKNRAIIKYKN